MGEQAIALAGAAAEAGPGTASGQVYAANTAAGRLPAHWSRSSSFRSLAHEVATGLIGPRPAPVITLIAHTPRKPLFLLLGSVVAIATGLGLAATVSDVPWQAMHGRRA